MTAKQFHRLVTRDESDFFDRFLAVLAQFHADYCVIDGLAVNAYTEPVVTLDCDVVVVAAKLAELEQALRQQFKVERFAHSLNVSAPGSELRVQLQTDDRYQEFLPQARPANVLGRVLPVAAPEDLLQGKLWTYQDETRRGSKRLKDLADIKRLVESKPELNQMIPEDIRRKLL